MVEVYLDTYRNEVTTREEALDRCAETIEEGDLYDYLQEKGISLFDIVPPDIIVEFGNLLFKEEDRFVRYTFDNEDVTV